MARARDEEDSDIEVEDAANQVEDEPEDNEGEEDEEEEEFEIETILESKSDAFGKVCVFDATMGRFVASHSQRRVLGQFRISREVERVCRGA